MKKVSIVLPVYNGEAYLRQAIESVLAQTYENWELIMVDDCSTDGSPAIMEEFARRDSRVRIVRNKVNQRLPESLNIGFRQARGDYFTWTSDDNRYMPDAIEAMTEALDSCPEYGLVYCGMEYIDQTGEPTGGVAGGSDVRVDNCVGACFLYRREAALATGEYDPDLVLVEDYDYWLRLSHRFPLLHLPACKYQYRYHPDSLTMTRSGQIQAQLYRLRQRELDFLLDGASEDQRSTLFYAMWVQNPEEMWGMREKFFPGGILPPSLDWMQKKREDGTEMEDARQIILFGAGVYGRKALEYFGREKVHCFIDNNPDHVGRVIEGVPVQSFSYLVENAGAYQVVISVSARIAVELANQLEEAGVKDYKLFIEMTGRLTKGSLKESLDYAGIFRRAEDWIDKNTVPGKGVINDTGFPEPYPEVTGYYIPTLLRWGWRERAKSYARWLCGIQREDGAWCDTSGRFPYVFDSAQILKGLLAVRELLPEVDEHIRRGCQWIISNIQPDGRLTTPDESLWNSQECSELIHLYCLEPLYTAAEVLGEASYRQAADRVKKYYLENRMDEIVNFGMLSHFYAYVMEALCDIGETELARRAMEKVSALQREDGSVPAYQNVNWVCSTGLFQFALVWYKLGEREKGNRAFRYACSLQNPTGGWYGGYARQEEASALDVKEYPSYFTDREISWAVKYFLDALSWKCLVEFEGQTDEFVNTTDKTDGRYLCVLEQVRAAGPGAAVCDIGCGKGRYLRGLLEDTAEQGVRFSCSDISSAALKSIPQGVEKRQGTLTCIPYPDESFDLTYTTEALEHAISTENGLRELVRVTKKGGRVLVVDKNNSKAGAVAVDDWEQWFDDGFFQKMADELDCRLEVHHDLPYDGGFQDGLFSGWVLYRNIASNDNI